MTITAEDMRDKLLTIDEAQEKLSTSEPLSTRSFTVGDDIWFKLENDWNADVENITGAEPVKVSVSINGSEFQLTKDTLLEATSICGLGKSYVCRTPAQLIAMQLNYWFKGGLSFEKDKDFKFLESNGVASALIRGSLQPFSNLRLLDEVLEGIRNKYGSDAQVLVDKKFFHSLKGTHLRLIVPEQSRVIERTGTDNDTWSLGIQLKNSLTGESQTSLDGYLFRWWCTNGALDTHATSGVWSRRGGQGQGDDVYDWARSSVDEILGGLEHSFDTVQTLVDIPVEGEAVSVLRDVFEQYKIPVPQRDAIIAEMVEAGPLNMYSVMNAITSVANDTDLSPAHAERLMRVGGDLVHTAHSRCDSCRRLLTH